MTERKDFEELDPARIIEEMRAEYWQGLSEPEQDSDQEKVQVLVVELGQEHFALDALCCRSITKVGHLTRVPRAPAYMPGVINLRGRITPVVDLAALFKLSAENRNKAKARLVVVETGSLRTAFLVDRILGIKWVERSRIREPESVTTAIKEEFVKGHVAPAATEQWITYLDMDKVVKEQELSKA